MARDAAGLERLLGEIAVLEAQHGRALPLVAAALVAEAALARQESRGGHFRLDFPQTSDTPRRTILPHGAARPAERAA